MFLGCSGIRTENTQPYIVILGRAPYDWADLGLLSVLHSNL